MNVPDHLLVNYLNLTTGWGPDRVDELTAQIAAGANPRDIKMALAYRLVELYHGDAAADAAQSDFRLVFQAGELPADIPERSLSPETAPAGIANPIRLLMDLGGDVPSSSEARRLLRQGAVRVNGKTLTGDEEVMIADGDVLQVGKRKFYRLRLAGRSSGDGAAK